MKTNIIASNQKSMKNSDPSISFSKENIGKIFEARFHPKIVTPRSYADQNDIVLFVHIPKTAGISLGRSLQGAFDVFRGVEWHDPRASFQKLSREALYLRTKTSSRQVISGHFGWPELAFWRNNELPIKAISVIRDPYTRFVSNYNYNCSVKHPAHEIFKDRFPTMQDYAETITPDFQLKQLVGPFYSFEHALEKLQRYYVFLGVTEKMEASMTHLSQALGLPEMPVHWDNTAPDQSTAVEVDPNLREIIMEKSVNDARLHQLLLSFY